LSSVRIWAVESDYDAEAVEELAKKLITHLGISTVVKKAIGRRAYSQVSNSGQLEKAIGIYLKESDYVIFVIDTDSIDRLSWNLLLLCAYSLPPGRPE
jgi:hypothetical protein